MSHFDEMDKNNNKTNDGGKTKLEVLKMFENENRKEKQKL